MTCKNIFEKFDMDGELCLPGKTISFGLLPWNKHPTFDGVELKHLLTGEDTAGKFSYHLIKIAPGKAIGCHSHQIQVETHEVIAGEATCQIDDREVICKPGDITLFPAGKPHEVHAGQDGLYVFAKFIPALL